MDNSKKTGWFAANAIFYKPISVRERKKPDVSKNK